MKKINLIISMRPEVALAIEKAKKQALPNKATPGASNA